MWESAEEIADRKRRAAELDKRELEREIATLRHDLHEERRAERERHKKHDLELTVQRRVAAEARAERERMRAQFEERLHVERRRHAREREESAALIAHLHDEVASARTEISELRRRGGATASDHAVGRPPPERLASGSGGSGGSVGASAAVERTSRAIEKDEFGNFVVVEHDVATGAYTVSKPRVEAAIQAERSSRPAPATPTAARTDSHLSDALSALLRRLDLERFIGRFEDEELYDIELLRSFGKELFAPNMRELGLDEHMIARFQAALSV